MSDLYPHIDQALQRVGLLGKKKLPILGELLDARDKEKMISEVKAAKRKRDKRTIYIPEKSAETGGESHCT